MFWNTRETFTSNGFPPLDRFSRPYTDKSTCQKKNPISKWYL